MIQTKKTEIIKIEYCRWGGHFKDRYWQAILPNGEVFDYGSQEHLIHECEKEGYDWEVIRHHKDNTQSGIKKSKTPLGAKARLSSFSCGGLSALKS